MRADLAIERSMLVDTKIPGRCTLFLFVWRGLSRSVQAFRGNTRREANRLMTKWVRRHKPTILTQREERRRLNDLRQLGPLRSYPMRVIATPSTVGRAGGHVRGA